MSAAKSSQTPASSIAPRRFTKASFADLAALAFVTLFTAILLRSTGWRSAAELMPWPDGLEYAAMATNIDRGLGPVLHFGGYSYPARYTEGYPLMLAAWMGPMKAFGILPAGAISVVYMTTLGLVCGLGSVLGVYAMSREHYGPLAAVIASVALALSPVFLTYSRLVLSDVPTLLVTLFAVMELQAASKEQQGRSSRKRILAYALAGLLSGFTVMIRPTNATILVGLAVALAMAPPAKPRELLLPLVVFAIAFSIAPLWQLHENAIHLGSPLASGYAWWVPEAYGSLGKTFNTSYLFGPTLPRNPHGNVIIYATALIGIDGLLGATDARYLLYPFAAAVFAVIGVRSILRDDQGAAAAKRLVWFGLGFLAALTLLYCFYFFTEVAFLLPATFVLFIAAGEGVVVANRWLREALANRLRKGRQRALLVSVIALDVLLTLSLVVEVSVRLQAPRSASLTVDALVETNSRISPRAMVVSNISLQFLELYMPGVDRRFVGLNSLDPGERFTDYHLHRLFVKRALGWNGPLPAVLFDNSADNTAMSSTAATSLLSMASGADGVYLLLCAPETPDYAQTLRSEMDAIHSVFGLERVSLTDATALYKLTPR